MKLEDLDEPGAALERISIAQRRQGYAMVLLVLGFCCLLWIIALDRFFEADRVLVGKMLILGDDELRERVVIGATGSVSHIVVKSPDGDSKLVAVVSAGGAQVSLFGRDGSPSVVIQAGQDGSLAIEEAGELRKVNVYPDKVRSQ